MADNYLENHHNDYLAAKARKEKARLHRQHLYLLAYRKRLAQQRAEVQVANQSANDTTADEKA